MQRAHRRYGLHTAQNADVTSAWVDLGASGYATNKGVEDGTGVCQMGMLSEFRLDQGANCNFLTDLHTLSPALDSFVHKDNLATLKYVLN